VNKVLTERKKMSIEMFFARGTSRYDTNNDLLSKTN